MHLARWTSHGFSWPVCDGKLPFFHSSSCWCGARCPWQKTIWKSSSLLWNTTWRVPQPKVGACGKCLRTSPHIYTDGEGAGGARAQASPDPHVRFCRAVQPSGVWHLQSLAGYFLFDLWTRVDLIVRHTEWNKVESHLKVFKLQSPLLHTGRQHPITIISVDKTPIRGCLTSIILWTNDHSHYCKNSRALQNEDFRPWLLHKSSGSISLLPKFHGLLSTVE